MTPKEHFSGGYLIYFIIFIVFFLNSYSNFVLLLFTIINTYTTCLETHKKAFLMS